MEKNNLVSFNNVYSLLDNSLVKEEIANSIMTMNEKTTKYNLELTKEQALDLVDTRVLSLKDNGLIDFDGDTVLKIIDNFYSSSHMSKIDYADTLNELVDMFYSYRINYGGFLSDDLIYEIMRYKFDKNGYVSLLTDEEEKRIKYNFRKGNSWDYSIDNPYDECEKWGITFE